MANSINLDNYCKDSIITIKGVEYNIPPISYKIAIKFGKIKENNLEQIIELIAEYLNTNRENATFTVEGLEAALSMKQITELMKFIVGEVANIEKN